MDLKFQMAFPWCGKKSILLNWLRIFGINYYLKRTMKSHAHTMLLEIELEIKRVCSSNCSSFASNSAEWEVMPAINII